MKTAIILEAKSRTGSGKGAARALRREKMVPAIVYGKDQQTSQIALPLKELTLEFVKGSFFNKIVDIKLDGKQFRALPRDVQMHPVTDVIEHADFQRVEKDTVIHVMVPVKVLNQEKSIGLKRGGVLNIVRHEIELLCTPDSIPHALEVDVLSVDIGHSIHINDLALPANVKTAIKGRNFTVVTIAGRSKEDEERPGAAAAADAAKPAAGAAAKPAAGAAKPAAGAAKPADAKKK